MRKLKIIDEWSQKSDRWRNAEIKLDETAVDTLHQQKEDQMSTFAQKHPLLIFFNVFEFKTDFFHLIYVIDV